MEQWKEALAKATSSERCDAKTRANGKCKSPAMQNGRCRMHGGKSTGAPCGKAHGRYKHGRYTKESVNFYKRLNQMMREVDELTELV